MIKIFVSLVKMFEESQCFDCIHSLLQGKVLVQVSNKAFKKSEKFFNSWLSLLYTKLVKFLGLQFVFCFETS